MMLALAGVAGIAGFAAFHSSRPKAGNEVEASQPAMNTAEVTAFGPTIPNKIAPPAAAPNGMVWIPGGEFSMGAMDPPAVNEFGMHEAVDARPIHRVYVDGFWMDRTDITNEEFARFVKATKYVTIAERAPTAEEFPGAPPENLVAGSIVFSPPESSRIAEQPFPMVVLCQKGRTGGILKDSAVTSRDAKSFPWFRWPTRTLWRTPGGRASVCPMKQSGSLQRAGSGRKALSMGRRIPAERQVDGKHLPGTFPCGRHRL